MADMVVKVSLDDRAGRTSGKRADAELHFLSGPLEGLKLIGFGVWERRGTPAGRYNVTFPARQYAINGERRSFALLRPTVDGNQQDAVKALILTAFDELQAAIAAGAA